MMKFEWDPKKAQLNLKKHDLSFDEAKTAFYDHDAIQYYDPEHSEEEDRFLLLGTSFQSNTIVVCHCFREEDSIMRIISARKADKSEEEAYWSNK